MDTEGERTGNAALEVMGGSMTMRVAGFSSGAQARAVGVGGITHPIQDGETGVAFYRFMMGTWGTTVRSHMGLIAAAGDNPIDSTNAGNPNRVAAGFRLVDNGTGFDLVTTDGVTVLQTGLARNRWYNVWIVADHAADVFDLYVGTATGPAGPATLPKSGDFVAGGIPFGVANPGSLNGMIFACPASPTGSGQATQMYVDEIWWDGDQGLSKPGNAVNPVPADGSPDVPRDVILAWTAGDGAIWHNVYFGTDRDAVEQANSRDTRRVYRGRQTAIAYRPVDALAMGQRCYWRIDEEGTSGVVNKGTVWGFKVAKYLVVDSFESYDDACNQILYTWLDGVGYPASAACGKGPLGGNGTGSIVEKATVPDAKRTIVYSGEQSMQLTYDNATPPYYSHAERTFSAPQDWTRFDVNMVAVYIRGDPANKSDTLYLEVGDSAQHSKLVSHPDPETVTKGSWKRWDVLLSEFAAGGVNLKSIKRIGIGIGDRTATEAGGQGKVYIDDIRLAEGAGALGLVAHWEFAEGSGDTASDSAGLNDGTVIGATWVPGKVGGALRFDGFDDYVDCGSGATLNPAELTVTLWVCPENVYVMAQSLAAKVGSESYDVDYSLQIGMMGAVKGLFRAGDSNVVVSGAKNLVTGEWMHLALTRDGNEMALYMNGGSRTSVGYSVQPGNGGYPLRIGGPRPYQGKIDDVRIYDQALPPEQIEQIAGGQM